MFVLRRQPACTDPGGNTINDTMETVPASDSSHDFFGRIQFKDGRLTVRESIDKMVPSEYQPEWETAPELTY
jgi:hypothetical protein